MNSTVAMTGAATGNSAERLAGELRYLVLAAQREGSRKLGRDLATVDLTPAQAEVLMVLAERAPMSLVDLGRHIVCESGSPSRIVDALVRRGLVERHPGTADRRVVMLELSAAGHALLPELREIDGSITAMASSRLSAAELDVLASALRKLVAGTLGGAAVARRFGGDRRHQ